MSKLFIYLLDFPVDKKQKMIQYHYYLFINLKYGVPQGSVLETLSSIYISRWRSHHPNLKLLWSSNPMFFEIKSWMAYNKLKFNDDKSEF